MLLFPLLVFPQNPYFNEVLLPAADDTTDEYTADDTLMWRVYIGGTSKPAWNMPTDYITVAEKKAEATIVYKLSDETEWTWGEMLEIGIKSSTDSTGFKTFRIGGLRGSVTVFITPDTLLTDTKTLYEKSRIGGN